MKTSFLLFQLQRIDSQSDVANKRSTEILSTIQNDDTVSNARSERDTLITQLEEIKKDFILIKDETDKNKLKNDQNSHILYSGSVKNPKELQDLQIEVDLIKKRIQELEEKQLDSMISQEELERLIKLAEEKLHSCENEFLTKKSLLLSEKDNLEINLIKWGQERKAISGQISDILLEKYEFLRKTKRGTAVSELQDGTCSACGTTLTPSQNQEAKIQNDLFFCPTCQRIIFTG